MRSRALAAERHAGAGALALLAILGCRTDTTGLERRDPPPGEATGTGGSTPSPSPPPAMMGNAGADGAPNLSGEGGSLVVLDGLVDGGRLFVCLRDAASGAGLEDDSLSGGSLSDGPRPPEGLEFGGFQRFPFDWDVSSLDVEVELFRAELGNPDAQSCATLRQAAAVSPPELPDAGASEPIVPLGARSAGSLTLARGSLFEGRHYALVATGCAVPEAVAMPQLCGAPDPLFGARSELVLVEFGAELTEGGSSFGLQFLNASRSLGLADLSLQVGAPEVSVPFASGVGFGVLRPRAVATVEQPFALELRGRGSNVTAYNQSWMDTLLAGSLELRPGANYLLASVGPVSRVDGVSSSAPLLVLIPAE
jgi:hypothetical protein